MLFLLLVILQCALYLCSDDDFNWTKTNVVCL